MATSLDLNLEPSRYPAVVYQFEHYMSKFGMTKAQAKHAVRRIQGEKVWRSSTHQVATNFFRSPALGGGQWLSVKAVDRSPILDRATLAHIMRTLFPGYAGFELLPAPSRLVDSANQYHLWAFPQEALKALQELHPEEVAKEGGWSSPWFEPGDTVDFAKPGISDWRELYLYKEARWPEREAALYWGSKEGVGADGWMLVLPRKKDTVAHFPFGFDSRNVSDADEHPGVGHKQRAFSGGYKSGAGS